MKHTRHSSTGPPYFGGILGVFIPGGTRYTCRSSRWLRWLFVILCTALCIQASDEGFNAGVYDWGTNNAFENVDGITNLDTLEFQDEYSEMPGENSKLDVQGISSENAMEFAGVSGEAEGYLELYDTYNEDEATSFMEVHAHNQQHAEHESKSKSANVHNGKSGSSTKGRPHSGGGHSTIRGGLNSSNKRPFKPRRKFTFKNVTLDVADTHVDLRDKNGIIVGRFTLSEDDSYTMALLNTLNGRSHANCEVKWVPQSQGKKTSEGRIHFDCNAKVPATGYTGEIPIAIEVSGINKDKTQKVYLNIDGYNFRREFDDIEAVKHAILLALGIDLDHKIKVTKVNGRSFSDEAGAYKAIMGQVDTGSKLIRLTVEPLIRVEANIQEPYSPSSELHSHEIGDLSIDEYIKLLKNRKKLSKVAKQTLGEDADDFTLVGINDFHDGSAGFDYLHPSKTPVEIDERWTFMPNVTARFHYLDTYITSKSYEVHTPLSKVVADGKEIMKKEGASKRKGKYRVYAYSLPGCPLEEGDITDMLKKDKNMTISMLPFSEACFNRRTHIMDFFYLNTRPSKYLFDVDLKNPDGSITSKRITVPYVDDTNLAALKEAIVAMFEKDGHLITPDDINFVDLVRSDGHNVDDKTKILKLSEIPKEQMMGQPSHITVDAHPHIMGYFTEPSGKHDTFEINLGSTKPSMEDIKHAFEDELHRRNLLKADEPLHAELKFHPVDKKHRIKKKKYVHPDEGGIFPAGSKLRYIAAEADNRYEIKVKYTNDDGKEHKFSILIPFGATDQQIEDIISAEIERHKYGTAPREMLIKIKGHEDDDLGDIWTHPFDDKMEFDVEPARSIDIKGIIEDHPTKFSLKIHPHEGGEEVERSIRHTLMRDPVFDRIFREHPDQLNDVSTLIMGENGNPYTDDDFANHDIYTNIKRIRIGVSDHPMTLVWKNPETGVETSFCFSKKSDGVCRGVPVQILAKLTFQHLSDILKNSLRKDSKELYDEMISLPRKNSNITSTLKLEGFTTIDGKQYQSYNVQMSDTVTILEHIYGINISHLASVKFTLMTHEEQRYLHERMVNKPSFRILMNKTSGEPESHVILGDDYGPAELRSVINKYFRGVDDGSNLETITINGEEYKDQPLSHFFKKLHDKAEPLKISFTVKDDAKETAPTVLNVRIQPKYHETLRSYFERAMEEPRDFGLSPLHSYNVACINENGERIHVDNMLDQPLNALTMCKNIEVIAKTQGRSNDSSRFFPLDPDEKIEMHTTITLDEHKDNVSDLNRQLRNFLLELPEDSLDHVTVIIDDKPVKCSLAALHEAYLIRNLTMDTLLSLCNIDGRKREPSVLRLNLNMDYPEDGKRGNMRAKASTLSDDTPLCVFTLQKGQHDIGITSAVPITMGTLKSPLKDFQSKITSMFGGSAAYIGDIRLSVVKNGDVAICSTGKKLRRLSDFKKVTLQAILQMCNIPVGVPEGNVFYHFRVVIPFGEDMTSHTNLSMGGTIPVEMLYKDDDEFSNLHYDEDLHLPIYDFLVDHPDVDMGHLHNYTLRVKGQNPGSEPINRSFHLDNLPSEMTLADIFPHTAMNNIVLEIDDTADPYNSAGGWQTGLAYPVNDYHSNFDAIKRQMIINLKGMHGNGLSNINGYSVVVSINGEKHRCHIKSLTELENMSFKDFTKNCINIERIHNNPSMRFNVAYESERGDAQVNLTCLSADYETLKVPHLSLNDNIPKKLIEELRKKYGDRGLKEAVWGVTINGMQGNCHIDDMDSETSFLEILEVCGVDDPHARVFDIAFYDLSLEYAEFEGDGSNYGGGASGNLKVKLSGRSGRGQSPLFPSYSHTMYPTSGFSKIHPNVFVNMPQDYRGPSVNVDGNKSVNDYMREIILDEDGASPGVPINIRIDNNGHNFDFNTIPMDDLNYPSDYLNGNISINVRSDEGGNLPGTIRTFHLPDVEKPLSAYFKILRARIPNMNDKKLVLLAKNAMLEEERIPMELLGRPLKELKKAGFVVCLVNDPHDDITAGEVRVNIISKDGYTGDLTITDLQEPVFEALKKMTDNKIDVSKLAGTNFKVIIDGIEKRCRLPGLNKLFTSVSMQDILRGCGVMDLNHSHDFTLYFDSLIGGENGSHRHPLKLEVDFEDKVDSTKNLDFSSGIDIGDSAFDYLNSKPNSHIFLDVEGKGGFKEFVEVDTEKFRQLLKLHPNVVDLLLRMGVPQEHLGGVECLKIVLSTLSQFLQGHQQYSVNNSEQGGNLSLDDPVSKCPDISSVEKSLQDNPHQDVTITVQLTNGNTKYFTITNNDFMHALRGGLSFKDVALWGLSKEEAEHMINMNFNATPYAGIPENIQQPLMEESKRPASPTPSTGSTEEKEKPKKRRAPSPPPKAPHSNNGSHNAGTITPTTLVSDVPVISKAIGEHNRNVKFVVKTKNDKTLEILVRGSTLQTESQRGTRIVDLLSYFMGNDDISAISGISVQMVSETKRFFVPLSSHEAFVMPVIASDHPTMCEIQEFKNPWNPPEDTYKRLTLEKAMDDYRSYYKIHKDIGVKGAYLLRKEEGNNISAEVLFDEKVPADKNTLNRNIGKDIDSGYTLFLRYLSYGELGP